MTVTTSMPMPTWQQLEPWLLLALIPGLGPLRQQKLLQHFGHPEQVLAASYPSLKQWLPEAVATAVTRQLSNGTAKQQLQQIQAWLKANGGHHILCLDSPLYPQALRNIADPPIVLYVRGNPALLTEPQLAIVGSRRPSPQGQRIATDLAEQLVNSGLVITSGMALGIDAAAHQGALNGKGGTIAVLGTGVDQVYPRQHRALYAALVERGAVISEFPLGTAPSPGHFPRRNRVIAGLTLGVLVIEAALGSGSLISARLAAEQGREVFAVPGSILNPLSHGCHQLIRDGARLVEKAGDVLAELRPILQGLLAADDQPTPAVASVATAAVEPLQQQVMAAMGFDTVTMDALSQQCAIPCDQLAVLLTDMELAGLITSVPGGYVRI